MWSKWSTGRQEEVETIQQGLQPAAFEASFPCNRCRWPISSRPVRTERCDSAVLRGGSSKELHRVQRLDIVMSVLKETMEPSLEELKAGQLIWDGSKGGWCGKNLKQKRSLQDSEWRFADDAASNSMSTELWNSHNSLHVNWNSPIANVRLAEISAERSFLCMPSQHSGHRRWFF